MPWTPLSLTAAAPAALWPRTTDRRRRRGYLLASAALVLAASAARPASAKVFLTQDEALRLAFPGCQVTRTTAYLTPAQLARAAQFAGGEVERALVVRYAARCAGKPGGVAYFDTHRVRTLPETLMVTVDPSGSVRRVEVLSFSEPEDYLPRAVWYGQFPGQKLGPELALKRRIREVTGATLTARATTDAVRRVLALHALLEPAP